MKALAEGHTHVMVRAQQIIVTTKVRDAARAEVAAFEAAGLGDLIDPMVLRIALAQPADQPIPSRMRWDLIAPIAYGIALAGVVWLLASDRGPRKGRRRH